MHPSTDTLCPGCFADTGASNPCPRCGYDTTLERGPLVLPHRTLLHGQFVVGRVLGKPGGFGITYLGWDLNLHTRVAIKEYLPRDLAGRSGDRATVAAHSGDDGEQFRFGLEQFIREARTLAQLDHPNIVRVRHFFEANGTAYLVMDYYEGLSLAEYLDQQGGRITEESAKALMLPILDGLRAVHAKGFLHRDIKPQNIYLARLDSGGVRPILLDFGAARHAMGERSRSLSVVVSPGYAPFEQYHRKGHQGPWTDIYSAAAVLYRMVTGEAPPEANERMVGDDLKPAAAFGVSNGLSDALGKALAIAAEARPQTVPAFQALLQGTAPVPTPAPQEAPEALRVPPSPTPSSPAHPRWLWPIVAGLLVLGSGGGYLAAERKIAADRQAEAEREAAASRAAEEARKAEAARQAEAALHRTADDRAYAVARGADTEGAYRIYLDQCAADGCGHRAEAEGRQAVLAEERQRKADRDRLTRKQTRMGLTLIHIPAGRFLMGSPDNEPERYSNEGPQHWVQVAAFELGETEVTRRQFGQFVKATNYRTDAERNAGGNKGCWVWLAVEKAGSYHAALNWRSSGITQGEDEPAVCLSWNDAQEYVRWLSRETGERWRLPTEAEWEYAARAETTTAFSTGNCISTHQANYRGDLEDYNNCGAKTGLFLSKTQPVKHYPPNPWGLYDMHGNVLEWVEDCYHDNYTGAPTDGSAWTQPSCPARVLRGGFWNIIPRDIRSASRFVQDPGDRYYGFGFRVARTLTP